MKTSRNCPMNGNLCMRYETYEDGKSQALKVVPGASG